MSIVFAKIFAGATMYSARLSRIFIGKEKIYQHTHD